MHKKSISCDKTGTFTQGKNRVVKISGKLLITALNVKLEEEKNRSQNEEARGQNEEARGQNEEVRSQNEEVRII